MQNLSSHLHTYQGYVGKLSKYQIYVTYNSKIKNPDKHAVWRAQVQAYMKGNTFAKETSLKTENHVRGINIITLKIGAKM